MGLVPASISFTTAAKWLCSHLISSDMAIALLALLISSCILEKLTNKGPMLWPVLGIVPSLLLHFNDLYDWATQWLIKTNGTFNYRGVIFMGSFGVITADPVKIEYMLKTNFKNFPKGKYFKERFHELLGNGIFNADDELWKLQRRAAVSEMHSGKFMEYSAGIMQELVHQKLLKLIEMVVIMSRGGRIDLQQVFLRFTFDNICAAAFGVNPGCLSLDLPDVQFAKAFEDATELTLLRFVQPPFIWKARRLLGIGSEKRLKEAAEIVHGFADQMVKERKMEAVRKAGGLDNRSDLLSRLIQAGYSEENGRKSYFSDELLKDFCISFILAGRDTSSVALSWFFWLIDKKPNVERKILGEIKHIITHRESINKEDNQVNEIIFTAEELNKMVYLQAALSETLRLYPPVPADFKEVLEDDIFPDGTTIKRGARIIYSIYSMARMELIWGEDCCEFKPERWIRDGNHVGENQFKYPVFNAGPRFCAGKKFAMMQMQMVAASILLRYSVKVVEGHVVCPKVTTTLYMKHGLMVSLEPRLNLR